MQDITQEKPVKIHGPPCRSLPPTALTQVLTLSELPLATSNIYLIILIFFV